MKTPTKIPICRMNVGAAIATNAKEWRYIFAPTYKLQAW
jgi:hypothetical protein